MKRLSQIIFAMTVMAGSSLWAAQERPVSGSNLGSVDGGDFKMAHQIIGKKCVFCHKDNRIDAALAAHKDMNAIQRSMEQKMEQRGMRLTSREREVLGIYWKSPLKEKK